MNAKQVIDREKQHFKIIAKLEQKLKDESSEPRRAAINSKILEENAEFRKFSVAVLKENIIEIDKALKHYAEDKAAAERNIENLNSLQKIVVAGRVLAIKGLKDLGENS